MGYIIQESHAIGLVLEPLYTYARGTLYKTQYEAMQKLAQQNLNLDQGFTLQFDGKSDSREGRPSNYPGRVLLRPGASFGFFKHLKCG